jgi:hypothetical protein
MRLSIFFLSLMLAACGAGPNTVPTGGDAAAGEHDLYRLGCGSYHTIPGIVGAHGKVKSQSRKDCQSQLHHGSATQPTAKSGALDSAPAFGSSRQLDARTRRY